MSARPISRPPETRRFGVIDIGSNSVRLVVFDGATRSPSYFFNEKVYCGLGTDVEATGRMSDDSKRRALATLRRFAAIADRLGADPVETVATAAMRDSEDGTAFAEEIEDATGLNVRIISGEEEGRYAGLGVLLGEARADGVVADIGGASMELARVGSGDVGTCVTTPIGPMRLMASGKRGAALTAHLRSTIAAVLPKIGAKPKHLYLVGGGWRAFAALDIVRNKHPLSVLQGYSMSPEQAMATADWVLDASQDDLRERGLSETRATNAPWTVHVLCALIEILEPGSLIASACGLREGLLYDNLSTDLRNSDPLTQSASVMEQLDARFPGFGERLARWMGPALPDIPERLRLAASMLADVNWRMHPDYRARACFSTVTQSSLVGLSHDERVFLAAALSFRYKDARDVIESEPSAALLSDPQLARAESLGRVIRLGAMLSAATPGILPDCPLTRSDAELSLSVPKVHAVLASEIVEKRLNSAANALGLDARLEILS